MRVLLVGAVATILLLIAAPAAAHTALEGSSPATGDVLSAPPDEIVLTFAAPISTDTVSGTLRSADGAVVDGVELLADPGQQVTTVTFALPEVPDGVYGFGWQTVGLADGHRVVGEIVYGVGGATTVADPTGFAGGPAVGAAQRALDATDLAGRIGWYVALAGLVGVTVLAGAARRRPETVVLVGAASRLLAPAAWVGAGAALVRGGAGVAIRVEAGAPVGAALTSRGTVGWAVAAVGMAAVGWAVRRGTTGALRWLPFAIGGLLLAGVLAGHAPSRPDPAMAVALAVAHGAAAAVWVGPLAVLLLAVRAPGWRVQEDADRRAGLRHLIAHVGRAAGWALLVVGVSGAVLALRALSDGASASAFTWVLVAKGALIAVIVVPLAGWHHRTRDRWAAPPRTVRLEVAGLVMALVAGTVLVGLDPGWRAAGATAPGVETAGPSDAAVPDGDGGVDDDLLAVLSGEGPDDPEDCLALDVGKSTCIRASLAGLMAREGPQPAIDAIAVLQAADQYVADNCHQVAHDLGNDASQSIPDLAEALAVDASICWSGYYHGVVEERLSGLDDAELLEAVATFCDPAAEVRYSFTHYNCLHGLGHGVMLRFDADLFASLPYCDEMREEWEQVSCASGMFMENIVAFQAGEETPALDDEDLLYPCGDVAEVYAESCYLMQTSYVLTRVGWDLQAGFDWCARAGDHVDACYRSMGRDISGAYLLDVDDVIAGCSQGDPQHAAWCIDGAVQNAVYDQSGRQAADALCEAVPEEWVEACTAGRDQAMAVVEAG